MKEMNSNDHQTIEMETEIHPVSIENPLTQTNHITITFKNISYTISKLTFNKHFLRDCTFPIQRKQMQILNDISGYVEPGEMIALMGGSGAGKSTLLDILCGISKTGKIDGTVLINNKPIHPYRKDIGYVSQQDYLKGTQTVREALEFYAKLKTPSSVTSEEIKQIVDEVLEILDLTKIQHSIIGTARRRGISGGEMKRVSIGCELVTNPGIVFLDEPTTGLDSFSSLAVVDALQRMARRGTTIICTIHQPRPLIFQKYDRIIMLSKGQCVYNGTPMHCKTFLKEIGFDAVDSVADTLVDAAAYEFANEKGKELLGQEFGGKKKSMIKLFQQQKIEIEQKIDEINAMELPPIKTMKGRPLGFYELYKRLLKSDRRDPSQIIGQLFSKIFFALLIGSVFFDVQNDQRGIRDKSGVLFFIITSQAMSLMDYLVQFIEERTLMRRESGKGLYTVASYYFAYMIHSIPFLIFYPLLYLAIAYPMVNLRSGFVHFLCMYGCLVLATLVGQGLYYSIATISPNLTIAQILTPICLVIFMIFTGFFIQKNNLIGFWLWAYYLSFMRYAFELILIDQFDGLEIYCTKDQLVGDLCPITSGNQYLDSLEITSSILVDYFVLLAFFIGFNCFVFIGLHIFNREKR